MKNANLQGVIHKNMAVEQSKIYVLKFYLLVIFCLGFFQNGISEVKISEKDSLKQVLEASELSEKSKILLQMAYRYVANEPDSVLFFLDQAILYASSEEIKGELFFEKALFYRFIEEEDKAIYFLDSTFNKLIGLNDSIAADALYYKQMLLANKGQYKEALKTGLKELKIRKVLSSRDKELNAILQIGYTYDRTGEYQKAIEWYEKGLEINGVQKEEYIGRNYGLIGIAYDELKDYEKAISYNLKAIEYFKKSPNSMFLYSWYSNIGNTYIKIGDYDLAEKYTLLALEEPENNRYVTKINLGKIYLEKGNLGKSETVLKGVLEELLQTSQISYLSEVYLRLNELYRKKGDFKTALSYYEKYKINEDERLSIEKINQLNELTIQYETAEKENQILIQNAKIAEDQLVLKNRNLWIFGLLAFAIIIGLLGFLLYKQQLLKNIKQQKDIDLKLAFEKIETQNRLHEQRLLISRDLHDNIGAQLSFIVSSIYTTKYFLEDSNLQLSVKLNQIALFANEAIQELRDTIWAMNKSEISLVDLKSRVANFIEKAKHSQPHIIISILVDEEMIQKTSFTANQGLNSFRIIQEAINNALKYANANHIFIEVDNHSGINFRITDDGIGFIEQEIEVGNGLVNMRKRAEDLGSELGILSELGKGTKISFSVI